MHFLPKNLAVALGSLPWLPAKNEPWPNHVPFMVSGHGLALWFTTPIYLWLAWPRRPKLVFGLAALAALGPCLMNLLYQNSGWFQFGYRFSNDYAIFLFVMLAASGRRLGKLFWVAAAWSVLWATFGAMTFERSRYEAFYSHDPGLVYPRD